MLLPWLALAFIYSASYARLSRAQMLETLSEDFVRTARAKGMTKFRVYGKHALRAAITPIVTIAGSGPGHHLGGTVVTETIFGFTGLGKASLERGDQPRYAAGHGDGAARRVVHRRGQRHRRRPLFVHRPESSSRIDPRARVGVGRADTRP